MKRFLRLALLPSLLLLLVAILWSCKSDSKNPMNPGGGTAADLTITITGINGANSYSPNPANVTQGQTVAWKNSGGTTHTATADGGAFNTGNISNGSTSAPITINTLGDLAYHCAIHGTLMTGTLHVTSAP